MVGTRKRSCGPTDPPPAKRARLKGDQPGLCDVVIAMAETGWLSAKELGVLEQTRKNARSTVCTEEVWEALCLRKWPNTKFMKENIEMIGGNRAWHRLRSVANVPTDRPEPLPPPTLKEEDFTFLVDIKVGGRCLISKKFNGSEIINRSPEGRVKFKLKASALCGGKHVLGDTNEIIQAEDFRSEAFTTEVQMLTPSRICTLVSSAREGYSHFFRQNDVKLAANRWKESDKERSNHVCVPPALDGKRNDGLQLRASLMGTLVKERLGNSFHVKAYPLAMFTNEGKVVVDAFRIGFFLGDEGFTKQRQDETGVSLLHVLEQLEGVPLSS